MLSLPVSLITSLTLIFVVSDLVAQGGPGHAPAKEADPNAKPANLDEAKSRIKKTGDHEYELGGIKFNSETREIRLPAEVNMNDGIIEYAIVHVNGKTHESLLRTSVIGFDLNVVMLLCHYEPHIGDLVATMKEPTPELKKEAAKPAVKAGANRIKVSVQWKDEKGEHTVPIEQWVRNTKTNALMSGDAFSYNGSVIDDGKFQADREGSYIAMYIDTLALMNNVEKDNWSDQIWTIEKSVVPPVDTKVTLVLSPVETPKK